MKVLFASRLMEEKEIWDLPVNEVRAWAYALKATTYCPMIHSPWEIKDFEQYDLIMVERRGCEGFIKWLVQNKLRVMLIEEGSLVGNDEDIISSDVTSWAKRVELWDMVDCVGAITGPHEIPVMQALTKTPIVNAHIPYPCDFTDTLIVPNDERKYILIPDKSYIFNAAVMKALPDERFCTSVLDGTKNTIKDVQTAYDHLGIDNITIQMPMQWTQYVTKILRYAKAAISLDPRQTCNRFAKDCAAFKVPIIGNIDNWVIQDLFPGGRVNLYDPKHAINMLTLIIDPNSGFTTEMTNYAHDQLKQNHNMDIATERLIKDLKKIKMI